jgi:hypothetical protein
MPNGLSPVMAGVIVVIFSLGGSKLPLWPRLSQRTRDRT